MLFSALVAVAAFINGFDIFGQRKIVVMVCPLWTQKGTLAKRMNSLLLTKFFCICSREHSYDGQNQTVEPFEGMAN
jgi:hypothetical protein